MTMKKSFQVLTVLLPLILVKVVPAAGDATSVDLRLPPWMAGHESLMPKITPEQIHEIEDLRARLKEADDRKSLSEQPEMLEIARTLAAKGDLIEKASIWLYVTAEPVERTPPDQFYVIAAFKRSEILGDLQFDPLVRPFLVPILRLRTDWIAGEVEGNRFPNMFESSEVQLMIYHLNLWGDASDRPRLERMRKAFEKSTAREAQFYRQFYALSQKGLPPLPDDSPASDAGLRRISKTISERIKSLFPENQAATTQTISGKGKEMSVPNKSGPKPATASQDPSTNTIKQPNAHGWLKWLAAAFVATVGAVWLFLRKSSK